MSVDDLMWEMEISARMQAELERDDALDRLATAERERWKHGIQVEGDYVCPSDLILHAQHDVIRLAQKLTEAYDAWRDARDLRAEEIFNAHQGAELMCDVCESLYADAEAALLAAVRTYNKTQETP